MYKLVLEGTEIRFDNFNGFVSAHQGENEILLSGKTEDEIIEECREFISYTGARLLGTANNKVILKCGDNLVLHLMLCHEKGMYCDARLLFP